MLNLVHCRQEVYGLATLAQLGTAVASAIAVVVLGSIAFCASAYSSRQPAFSTSLSQVGEWVEQSGKSTVLRGNIAEKLGFWNIDLPVHERGFRITGEQLTHVCSTPDLPEFRDNVFLAQVDENTGDAVIWRAKRNGDLLMTAQFTGGLAKTVPNETEQTAFAAEREYFLKKMRADIFRNNPAPADTPLASPIPLQPAAAPTVKTPSRRLSFPSEITVFLLYPWVIPVAIVALLMGACVRSKR
jgi:hypothetical protein